MNRRLKSAFISLFFAHLSGCGQTASEVVSPPEQQSCAADIAIVEVLDGILRNHCGCQEAAGTYGTADAPLVCTVAHGTRIHFLYSASRLTHQIISVGFPAFAPSPVSDPEGAVSVPSHAVKLDVPGNYVFHDAFNSAITGRIVVQ